MNISELWGACWRLGNFSASLLGSHLLGSAQEMFGNVCPRSIEFATQWQVDIKIQLWGGGGARGNQNLQL